MPKILDKYKLRINIFLTDVIKPEFKDFYYPPPKNDFNSQKFSTWREIVDLRGPEMEGLVSALIENEVFVTPTFVAVEVQVWGDNPDTRELYETDFAPKIMAGRWQKQNKHPNTSSWSEEDFKEFRAT